MIKLHLPWSRCPQWRWSSRLERLRLWSEPADRFSPHLNPRPASPETRREGGWWRCYLHKHRGLSRAPQQTLPKPWSEEETRTETEFLIAELCWRLLWFGTSGSGCVSMQELILIWVAGCAWSAVIRGWLCFKHSQSWAGILAALSQTTHTGRI